MRRHELTDEQWERLEPLLPPQRPATGRPAKDHRLVLNDVLWILRTGASMYEQAGAAPGPNGSAEEEPAAETDEATVEGEFREVPN